MSSMKDTFFSFGGTSHPKMEEFKVTAPEWAKEGDSIEIEANKQRYVVAVPAGISKGHAFKVAVPGLSPSAGELRAGLPFPLRVCCTCCSTAWLVVVWGCVVFSYFVLIILREVRWNAATLVVAHAVISLQVASYVRCQVTPPGTVTKEWQRQAASGLEPSESCKRSGLLQPARGVFVSHEGKVVLGLDHYCFWCARPCLPRLPRSGRLPLPTPSRLCAPRLTPHAPRRTPHAARPTRASVTALPTPSHSPGSAPPSASAIVSIFCSSYSTRAASPSSPDRMRCTSCWSGCQVSCLVITPLMSCWSGCQVSRALGRQSRDRATEQMDGWVGGWVGG